MENTESQATTTTKLKRIAHLSVKNPEVKFTSLMHHFNKESLTECFKGLDGKKAVGLDQITKEDYGANLSSNIDELLRRMKRMAYKPSPVQEVLIPKEGKAKAFRPLGISNFEDKLVQSQMKKVLESIYEPMFLECSYGFRPGLGCHDAIQALRQYLFSHSVQTVIDVDLENFFGTINHKILEQFLHNRIGDKRLLRYIHRMFKAGVLSEGELRKDDAGVPQGSCCSPILANIMAHYVIDEWFETIVKAHCRGKVAMFRYADDLIICCEYSKDAVRIVNALYKRLTKYELKMNDTKTKMVSFSKAHGRRGRKQGTFDFLGFTFYLGKSKSGKIIPKVRTSKSSFRNKLHNVNMWSKRFCRKRKIKVVWRVFCTKLVGHINYYGVSFNTNRVREFIHRSIKILFRWLNRRSQKRSYTWDKFNRFIALNLPPIAKVVHPLF